MSLNDLWDAIPSRPNVGTYKKFYNMLRKGYMNPCYAMCISPTTNSVLELWEVHMLGRIKYFDVKSGALVGIICY